MGIDDFEPEDLDTELESEGSVKRSKDVDIMKQYGASRENTPKTTYNTRELRRQVGITKSNYFDSADFKPFTGLEEVDKILNMRELKLGKETQLVRMWGCKKCWMRGTDDCPYNVPDGQETNKGYCDYAIKSQLIQYQLMHSTNGLKHLWGINTANLWQMLQHYIGKLQRLKLNDRVTKTEQYLLKNVIKLQSELAERLENSLAREQNTKLETAKMTPDQFQNYVNNWASQKVKEVNGKVVKEDE